MMPEAYVCQVIAVPEDVDLEDERRASGSGFKRVESLH
jgi:hypothetical protein